MRDDDNDGDSCYSQEANGPLGKGMVVKRHHYESLYYNSRQTTISLPGINPIDNPCKSSPIYTVKSICNRCYF